MIVSKVDAADALNGGALVGTPHSARPLGLEKATFSLAVVCLLLVVGAIYISPYLTTTVSRWSDLSDAVIRPREVNAVNIVSALWISLSLVIGILGLIPTNLNLGRCLDFIMPHHIHCSACPERSACTHSDDATRIIQHINRNLKGSVAVTAILIFVLTLCAVGALLFWRSGRLAALAAFSSLAFFAGVLVADGLAMRACNFLQELRRVVTRSELTRATRPDGQFLFLVEEGDSRLLSKRLSGFGRMFTILDVPMTISLVLLSSAAWWTHSRGVIEKIFGQAFEIGGTLMHVVLATTVAMALERERRLPAPGESCVAKLRQQNGQAMAEVPTFFFDASVFLGLFADSDLAETCEAVLASFDGKLCAGLTTYDEIARIDDRIWSVRDEEVQRRMFAFMDRMFNELQISRAPTQEFIRERDEFLADGAQWDGRSAVADLLHSQYDMGVVRVIGGKVRIMAPSEPFRNDDFARRSPSRRFSGMLAGLLQEARAALAELGSENTRGISISLVVYPPPSLSRRTAFDS